MNYNGSNSPFVVWASCLLWMISLFTIGWSLLLFFTFDDLLLLTGMDLVNSFVLLSGIIMLPTKINMLCSVANGKKIDYKAKVICCPLWLSILWIIVINATAAVVCFFKVFSCSVLINENMEHGMEYYRSVPKYKHFLDTLQWSLKCCGLNSYKDWFTQDWYDKIRDYEWDVSSKNGKTVRKREVTDSVPLSCCKSGSCISNYLTELGTYSINTDGCAPLMYRIVMVSLYAHLTIFVLIVVLELIILKFIMKEDKLNTKNCRRVNNDVRHIMAIKYNFDASSGSCQLNPEDSDEVEASRYPDYEK